MVSVRLHFPQEARAPSATISRDVLTYTSMCGNQQHNIPEIENNYWFLNFGGGQVMAKKGKTSFKKKKKEDTHKRNDREEYSAEFNAVIHNNAQQPKQSNK